MTALRMALVGAGRIAAAYADVLGGWGAVDIVGVADLDLSASGSLADVLGCESFSNHQELIDIAQPDAAIICTPPNTHHAITIELLRAGVHVMCEKPLALSLDDAIEMIAVADAAELTLTMASKFRYVEDVVEARSIASSGVLGEIVLLENNFASRVDMSTRWNSDLDVAGGGVLIDNGTHSVDLVRFFVGPISQVMALEGKRTQAVTVEDTAQVFLRSETGVRATIDLSWSLNKERPWFLEVYASEGTIQVGWDESRYRLGARDEWISFGSGYDKKKAIRDQVANFARAIQGVEQLVITGLDALASVEVVEAAYQSLRQDDWVTVGIASAATTPR